MEEWARCRGVGSQLIMRTIDRVLDELIARSGERSDAASQSQTWLRVEVSALAWNERAIRTYERLGFVNITRQRGVQFYSLEISS